MLRDAAMAVVMSSLIVGSVQAQKKPIELGLDGALSYKVNDPTALLIGLPVQSFRVGFFTSEQLSIEPAVAWNLIKVGDGDAIYTLGAALGVLYHFAADAERSRVYVRPFAGIDLIGGGGESASQFMVGAGIGIKTAVRNHLGARVEAGFEYAPENDDFGKAATLFLKFGFSFVTR